MLAVALFNQRRAVFSHGLARRNQRAHLLRIARQADLRVARKLKVIAKKWVILPNDAAFRESRTLESFSQERSAGLGVTRDFPVLSAEVQQRALLRCSSASSTSA